MYCIIVRLVYHIREVMPTPRGDGGGRRLLHSLVELEVLNRDSDTITYYRVNIHMIHNTLI